MYWWGYHTNYGWVVLDRNYSNNQASQIDSLTFNIATTLETFSCSRKDWEEPDFIYAPKYLKNLPKTATIEFESLKVEVEKQLHALFEEQLRAVLEKKQVKAKADLKKKQLQAIKNHQVFLKNKGLPNKGVARSEPNKRHRITHCYSCKNSLDNEINSQCAACQWIICECGACGCGYEFQRYQKST